MGGFPVGHFGVYVSTRFDVIMGSKNRPFLPGYLSSLENLVAKRRYQEKLALIGGLDPYETVRSEWIDDVDLWPSVTCVNVAMYLLLTPSPYSGEDLVNYKSMDCYVNFLSGWVREILVKAPSDRLRVVIAKVSSGMINIMPDFFILVKQYYR